MVEYVERDESKEVGAADEGKREEKTAFDSCEDDGRHGRDLVALLDEGHVWLLLVLGLGKGRLLLRGRRASTLNPERNSRDGEIDSNQHGAGQVSADANKAIGLHQEVEEETLVQMFEEVVQAAEQALNRSSQRHLIMPSISHSLERYSVYVVRNEGAVGTRGMAKTLADHAAEHGLESFLVAVLVVPHTL